MELRSQFIALDNELDTERQSEAFSKSQRNLFTTNYAYIRINFIPLKAH